MSTKFSTKLRTLEIDSTANAALRAGESVVDYSSKVKYTNIVLVPTRDCCKPYLVIPEGFWALVTSFGEYVGIWEAGLHFAAPWQQISHLVTQQYSVYDVPVKECPTADNVMVEIDVSLVFNIKKSDEDVRNFVFKLGPERLDVQLKAFQEEAVRTLARQKKYSDIYDLMETEDLALPTIVNKEEDEIAQHALDATPGVKSSTSLASEVIHQPGKPLLAAVSYPGQGGEGAGQPYVAQVAGQPYVAQVSGQPPMVSQNVGDVQKHMERAKATMNNQLADFGVEVYSITITNVQLPPNFTQQMEEATTFDSRNKKQAAMQKYQLKVIEDDETREQAEQKLRENLAELKSQNEQRVADEKKQTNVYIAQTNATIADINEKMISDLRNIDATKELLIAQINKEKDVQFATIMAESLAEEEKIKFETEAYVKTKRAEAGVKVAELEANACRVIAGAEKTATAGLVSKRDFAEKKGKLEALKRLSNNKNLVLTGTNKDNPMAQLIGASQSSIALGLNP